MEGNSLTHEWEQATKLYLKWPAFIYTNAATTTTTNNNNNIVILAETYTGRKIFFMSKTQ